MTTHFVPSAHNSQIAYEICGSGPALLLVHGFNNDRSLWQQHGWVEHLQSDYQVITMDVRGCGESTATTDPAHYSQAAHLADVAAVLDACGIERCLYWGWSFGATIGTHLAAYTQRLHAAIIAGTYFGPLFRQEEWRNDNVQIARIAKAKAEGRLDELDLLPERRRRAEITNLDLLWARRHGVEEWPAVAPSDLQCPALIYTGTNDGRVVSQLRQKQVEIEAAGLRLHIFQGFDHLQLVSERNQVAPIVQSFLQP